MSIPKPDKALEGHCSAVNDDTLYVFSPDSFQSLQLKENATWSEEKMGTPVTGAVCVKAGNALYVVGGTSDGDDYDGLQRYHFDSKAWETLSLPTSNIKGRTNHSAALLEDANAILVYAGSQTEAPSLLSSQTFTIELTDPYNIEAFVSSAPPSNQPILLPWNSSHAVMAGGSPYSSEVFTFDHTGGWQPLGTNLTEPLQSSVRGTLVSGDDGSKVLETYDLSSSPNKVSQIVLLDAGGATAMNGQTVGSSSSSRKPKRDLTLDNWPQYNNTNAPSASRSDFAVAQDSKGLAVMSGGNDDQPVSLFDQKDNSWVDAGKFFNADDQQPLKPMPTTDPSSATPTSTSEPSATSSEAAGSGGLSSHDKMLRTLGITLGVLCGIAAIFIAALLYVRWRKMKKRKQEGYVDEKTGNRLSFADRGASFMKEAGGSMDHIAQPPRNPYGPNAGSHSSLAIIAGRLGANKRNTGSHQPQRGSFESTAPLRNKEFGEPVEMMDIGEKSPVERKPVPNKNLQVPGQAPPNLAVFSASPEEDSQLRNRSSGWSRYFATSQPANNEHLPTAYTKDRDSSASNLHSTSTMSRIPSSAMVAPLDIDFTKTVDGQRLSNVITGSPAFSDSREDLARGGSFAAEGQRGLIEGNDRPISTNTDVSSAYDRSTMSSDFYSGLAAERGSTPWTPVSNSFKDHLVNRPTTGTSSNYTSSIYEQRLPSRAARSGNSGFFPGSGTMNIKPAKLKLGHTASPSSDWATAGGAAKDSPLLKEQPAIKAPAPVHDRDSTATVFPHNNGNRWTANAPKNAGVGALQPPHPTNAFAQSAAMDRASTATVFPHDNGNRWTAHAPKDTAAGALQPPRAPALTGGAAANPASDRDSTVTVFPHEDGNDWTAGALKAPKAPGLANGAAQPANDRDSTVTVFPRGVPSAYYANRPKEIDEHEANKQPMNSDMSWLDLGTGANRI